MCGGGCGSRPPVRWPASLCPLPASASGPGPAVPSHSCLARPGSGEEGGIMGTTMECCNTLKTLVVHRIAISYSVGY